MANQNPFIVATSHHQEAPVDWMPASGVEPLILDDPVLLWLRYHGAKHGLQPDSGPYGFLDFVSQKGKQFEDRWIRELAPGAIRICANGHEVRSVDKVRETYELMQRGVPVLVQPALWWAPEQIYGAPDVLAHTAWLETHLPHLLGECTPRTGTIHLDGSGRLGHYVVLDMKFTSNLESKRKELRSYAAQVRIYTYMLGHLQGVMPQKGYLVTRDHMFDPVPVRVTSVLNEPLDEDLATARDRYLDIKLNGAEHTPWGDETVAPNLRHGTDRWHRAKQIIAQDKTPGRDPGIVFQISSKAKLDLARYGFCSVESLLRADPSTIPLEECAGLGPVKSQQIRAILEANRSGRPIVPAGYLRPPRKEFEFYVDFEYFTNINVDFERQWPMLDGCEMIFMIGVGWEEKGNWCFRAFVAAAEEHAQERNMLAEFLGFLWTLSDGRFTDGNRTAIYHWTGAEVWQAIRAADRQRLSGDHPLRALPWCDLQKIFLEGPIGLPGLWNYQLKDVSRAVNQLDPDLDLQWPGDLAQGLQAMVMGWKAYENPNPLDSREMATIKEYLNSDCRALWGILKWLRS